ncbi:MAG TPA: beta-L-arabinofuranosidase domain-containing protein [Spirochaetia bacterium]|nr:beta-L-arabinofuranosidase domain-containing protein [Spirochaetia bacterium]
MSEGFPVSAQPRSKIDGGFWKGYQDLLRNKVIPYQWKAMNDEIPGAPKSHSVENFRIAAGVRSGTYEGMVFQDSDLAKWLEAAGYLLAEEGAGNSALRAWVDEAVDLVSRAQQPDGYLNTYFTVKEPSARWTNLREAHELYSAGHMIEAGVSLYLGAGNQRILEVVKRLADHIDSRFGPQAGKVRGYCGHEEVELALVKLARATGETRYLRLASYFVDERGRSPSYFQTEAAAPGYHPFFGIKSLDYYQAHAPVREQPDAVGHAVRAVYLYTAMADLAQETGDPSLAEACERLWQSVTRRKMYITGGIGSSAHLESFGADFDLPNDIAYAETCAAIGLFFFSARMVRLRSQAKYADVMERALHNGILSGLALDGESYFYVNPLGVIPAVCDANGGYRHVKYRRQPWYGCACCPPNIARLLASLGQYAYHCSGDALYADLFHEGTVTVGIGNDTIRLKQSTRYPWDGRIRFQWLSETRSDLTLAVRIPSWCVGAPLQVNGAAVAAGADADGYARVRRRWSAGDTVELTLPLTIQRMRADPRVAGNRGRVAIQRGPIVYCLEEADNGDNLAGIRLPQDAVLEASHRGDLLGGVTVIRTTGLSDAGERGAAGSTTTDGELYSNRGAPRADRKELTFVPYYAWANRTPGEMVVWVRE